jgi:GT2 family glycosyltransferase
MAGRVAVHLLTRDSSRWIEECLAGISAQSRPPDRIRLIDCASTDGTRDLLGAAARGDSRVELVLLDENRGYTGGHNAGLRQGREEAVLLLNPDVRLAPTYIAETLAALERHPGAGAITGRLLRADDHLRPVPGPILDSTGIVMTRSQRHLDRGAGEIDGGQFEIEEEVFGASGAAPLYRRAMLEDVAVDGEVFDEDFFAYREDADLAWRARLLGWTAFYTPRAVAYHRRQVRPGRRADVPPEINRFSVRNRFLLRLKNQTVSNLARTLLPGLARDLAVVTWVLAAEHTSLPGLVDVLRLRRSAWSKRRRIMARRRASGWDVDRWFLAAGRAGRRMAGS